MRKREKEVLLELLNNAKISDRQLAKKLDTSQSTVTRIRKKLEKDVIKSYVAFPDFSKLNINLASVSFGRCNNPKKTIVKCLEEFSDKTPRIIFAGDGEGMGKSCMIVCVHSDFSDYMNFSREFKSWCKGITDVSDSFLISTKDSFQIFNLNRPVEDMLKEKKPKK